MKNLTTTLKITATIIILLTTLLVSNIMSVIDIKKLRNDVVVLKTEIVVLKKTIVENTEQKETIKTLEQRITELNKIIEKQKKENKNLQKKTNKKHNDRLHSYLLANNVIDADKLFADMNNNTKYDWKYKGQKYRNIYTNIHFLYKF